MTRRRVLGFVEVDSATLLLSDPCSVLPWQAQGREGLDYAAVIGVDTRPAAQELGRPGVLLLQGFGGDGRYPVYGQFRDGLLAQVVIDLDVEPEE